MKIPTFLADYTESVLNAQVANGSPAATFTADRTGATISPGTYLDSAGVMQIMAATDDIPRYNHGYYDTTGYHAFTKSGVLIEGATTNYPIRTDGTSSAAGLWSSWISAGWSAVSGGVITTTQSDSVNGTLINLASSQAQRLEITADGADVDKDWGITFTTIGIGTFVQGEVGTISGWVRSQGGNSGVQIKLGIKERDVADAAVAAQVGSDIAGTIDTTWRYFQETFTMGHADCSRVCGGIIVLDIDSGDTADVEFYGIQCEKLPFASSFVPTTTAALTRNTEVLKYANSGNRTANQESCVAKVACEEAGSATTLNMKIHDSETKRRRLEIYQNDINVYSNSNDDAESKITDIRNSNWTANQELSFGYTMQVGASPYIAGYSEGVASGTNETADDFTPNAWGTNFYVGVNSDGSANPFYGTIFSIAFWDVVLTEANQLTLHNNTDWDWAKIKMMKRPVFAADYSESVLNAQVAVGSPVATFTASRDATHPATYFDSAGVMQKTITANVGRFNYGYYNTTGYHAFTKSGVLIEGATTNYLTYGIFSSDAGSGLSTGWTIDEDDSGAITTTLTDATSYFNVGTTVNSQGIALTFNDGSYANLYQITGAASFAQNDNVTISCWIKGTSSGLTYIKLRYIEKDNGDVSGTTHAGSDIQTLISSTEWRKFTFSGTCDDADCNKVYMGIAITGGTPDAFDLEIACFQVEKLPFASSFVPTTTAALTRNAEELEYKIAGNRTATESCVAKIAPEYASSIIATNCYITVTDTKRRYLRFNSGLDTVSISPNSTDNTGCTVNDLVNEAWTANTEMTLGYTMSHVSPYIAGYYNGVADGTNETADDFTDPAWETNFQVGYYGDATNQLYGTIFSIAFWDVVLTGVENLTAHTKNLDWVKGNKVFLGVEF